MGLKLADDLHAELGGIKIPEMGGDNLAITLCSHFENPDQEDDGDTGWTPDAVAGYEATVAAIKAHYQPLSDRIEELAAEVQRKDIALLQAKQFIENGIEFSFIRMPACKEDPAHLTLPAIIEALGDAPAIRDIPGEPPRDGKEYHVTMAVPVRWKAYHPKSEQARAGISGRWQRMNQYGGWDNLPADERIWPFESYQIVT